MLRSLTAVSWCSVDMAMRYKNAVGQLVHVSPLDLQRSVVRAGVQRTLKGVWRLLARHLVSDEALAKRLPVMYSRTFDRGAVRVAHFEAGNAKLALTGWAQIHDYDVEGLGFGMETIMELAGRDTPRVRWQRLNSNVNFEVRWNHTKSSKPSATSNLT